MKTQPLPISIATTLLCFGLAAPLAAAERWSIGLTTNDAPIEALVVPGAAGSAFTVLLLGGLQGPDASSDTVRKEVDALEKLANRLRLPENLPHTARSLALR